MIRTNKGEILEAFLNGATIIDGHDDTVIDRECSIIKLADPERPFCLFLHGARYQSLNGLGIRDDGTLRLSPVSVGGVVMGGLTESSIKEYNDSVSIKGIEIVEWIDRDGTIHSTEVDA